MTTSEISQMTKAEKLRAMEALWADLSSESSDVESPAWHIQALQETEVRRANGQEEVVDWSEAKRQLRQRLDD